MDFVISAAAALFTGLLASLGVGGGMILMVYLTIFAGISQITAQGINLVFFLPIAVLALIFHSRNKLVEWKKIIPAIITGAIGAVLGTYLAQYLGSDILKKIFAGFIFLIGIKEIFSKREKPQTEKTS